MNRQPPPPAPHIVPRTSGPAAMPAQTTVVQRPSLGRTVSSLSGPVGRVVGALDARLLRVASTTSAADAGQVGEALLEMAQLAHLRRGFLPYVIDSRASGEPQRIDAVLAETMLGAVDCAWGALAELDGGPARRALQLISFVRELCGQLRALGAAVDHEKHRVDEIRQALAKQSEGAIGSAMRDAAALYREVRVKLDAHSPHQAPSLLDEWLRPAP